MSSPFIFEKHALWISFFVILILVAIAYGTSFRNGFVWDDETFIVNNPFVHDISRWPQYFTNPESISSDPILSKMYRPLQTLSFALDARLWDKWAGGFHMTSLFLHVASCLAIVFAFRTLIGAKPAIAAAFIFAIHPAISEGVLSLAARGNQLYTLFALLSIGLFVRITQPFDKNHILSILTMALSLFSKEPAIALIAILPFVQSVSGQPWNLRTKKSLLLYIPFLIAAVIYLAMRAAVVDITKVIPYWGGSLWATIQMQAKVFAVYLHLLIWPFNLKGRYTIAPPAPFPDPLVIGAVMLNLALVTLGILVYRQGTKGKLLALAIAWFYISLAPVANLIPLPGSMMGERFIYFTFAGVIPLLSGTVSDKEWKRLQNMVLICGIGILTAWFITDIRRTADWKDNTAFFTLLSKQQPNDPAVQIRMAQVELSVKDVTSALRRLEQFMPSVYSIPTPHERSILHYWYGRALLDANRPHEAYKELSIAAYLRPESSKDVVVLRAEAAARSGNLTIARLILEQGLKSFPQDDAVWNGLGNVLIMAGDVSGAISSYKHALEINPHNSEAAINLQNALKKDHDNTNK